MNPNGRRNGNSFYNFGEFTGLQEGARLTVVAIKNDQILVSYVSPNRQSFGSEAGNGTLFLIPESIFVTMTPDYEAMKKLRKKGRIELLLFLRKTYRSEKFLI